MILYIQSYLFIERDKTKQCIYAWFNRNTQTVNSLLFCVGCSCHSPCSFDKPLSSETSSSRIVSQLIALVIVLYQFITAYGLLSFFLINLLLNIVRAANSYEHECNRILHTEILCIHSITSDNKELVRCEYYICMECFLVCCVLKTSQALSMATSSINREFETSQNLNISYHRSRDIRPVADDEEALIGFV